MLGKSVNRHPAPLQHSKEYRSYKHARRMIAPQECDCDSSEAIVIREAVVISIPIAEHFIDSNHAGESPRNRHRQNNLLANRDAAVFRRRWILTRRANFVTPLCLPEKNVSQD